MFFRTHLAAALFLVLLFFPYITNPLVFLPVVLIATVIPDIDTRFSKIGSHKIFRVFNFFVRHRGAMHSFTFLLFVSPLIFFLFREALLPFLSAYSLHLLLDALTVQGIAPFFPLKLRIKGIIKTGGIIENFLFLFLVLADLFLIFSKIYLIVK